MGNKSISEFNDFEDSFDAFIEIAADLKDRSCMLDWPQGGTNRGEKTTFATGNINAFNDIYER